MSSVYNQGMSRFLIDGYNLLHGLGLLPKRAPPGELQQARTRLLQFLAATLGKKAAAATVVFDAAGAPRRGQAEQWFGNIRVLFAQREPQADDLIENLLAQDRATSSLIIVSDDHRLQQAARRHRALPMGCSEFLDFLEKIKPARPSPPRLKQDHDMSPQELQQWLAEFGDLENNPEFKDLFDHFD